MSSRNPFEELERAVERMRRQFEDTSRSWSEGNFDFGFGAAEEMALDVVETDDEFRVTVDLPGFERDDVDLRLTGTMLTVDAARGEGEETTEGDYVRHERRRESLHRAVTLPGPVEEDDVTARMRNGVLTVTLPRADSERSIDIR